MNRLDRRIYLLRGKRGGAFNQDQYWLEGARRARAIRRIRVLVRRMWPVVVRVAPFGGTGRFLSELMQDLQLGQPAVRTVRISARSIRDLSEHEAGCRVLRVLLELLRVEGDPKHLVERHGVHRVLERLVRGARGRPAVLVVDEAEHLSREMLTAVLRAFTGTSALARSVTVLLVGSLELAKPRVRGLVQLTLPDFSEKETHEALVEWFGDVPEPILAAVAPLFGGVPELIDAYGRSSDRMEISRGAIAERLGDFGNALRHQRAQLGNVALEQRIDLLMGQTSDAVAGSTDARLIGSGLVRAMGGRVGLRAPLFRDLLREVHR